MIAYVFRTPQPYNNENLRHSPSWWATNLHATWFLGYGMRGGVDSSYHSEFSAIDDFVANLAYLYHRPLQRPLIIVVLVQVKGVHICMHLWMLSYIDFGIFYSFFTRPRWSDLACYYSTLNDPST